MRKFKWLIRILYPSPLPSEPKTGSMEGFTSPRISTEVHAKVNEWLDVQKYKCELNGDYSFIILGDLNSLLSGERGQDIIVDS